MIEVYDHLAIDSHQRDLFEIFLASCNGTLNEINIEWIDKKSLCVVLCSNGYPDEYQKNIEIKNFEKISLDKNNFLFHAGTEEKKVV